MSPSWQCWNIFSPFPPPLSFFFLNGMGDATAVACYAPVSPLMI